MRCLEQHRRFVRGADLAQQLLALPGARRQKADKAESPGFQTGRGQARQQTARTGNRHHAQSGVERRSHDDRTGIGDSWRTGIGRQRDALAAAQSLDDRRGGRSLVVLVRRYKRRIDAIACEQRACDARVLDGDRVDVREYPEGA